MVKAGSSVLALAVLVMSGATTGATAATRQGNGAPAVAMVHGPAVHGPAVHGPAVHGPVVHGPAHPGNYGPRYLPYTPNGAIGVRLVAGPPQSFAPPPSAFGPRPYFTNHHDTRRHHHGHHVYGYGYGGGYSYPETDLEPLAEYSDGVSNGYFSSYDRCAWLADRIRHGGPREWRRRYVACRQTEAELRRS